jgi:thiamine biosynthesis lipoprotein
MGTLFEAVAWAPDSATGRAALEAARAVVVRVDSLMSTYKPESELSRMAASAGTGHWTPLSAETLEVLETALEWARASGGAFDPTVGPLVDLWGFHEGEGRVPSDEEIAAARGTVGWEKVEVEPTVSRARLPVEGMELDFGAIAKGYALDLATRAMRRAGASAGTVDLGGNVSVFGARPGGGGWSLGIRHPRDADRLLGRIEINGGSVATSGDYERYFEVDGVRYSHILDPRTGWPARGVIQTTAAAPTGIEADALSTTLFVLGPEAGRDLLARRAPEATAVWVTDPGSEAIRRGHVIVAGQDSPRTELLLER